MPKDFSRIPSGMLVLFAILMSLTLCMALHLYHGYPGSTTPSAPIAILFLFFCPDFKHRGSITWKQFDLLGCLTYLASSELITTLQESGGESIVWSSAAFIVCMILAGVTFAYFAGWISWSPKREHSIIPLFPTRTVTRVGLCCLISIL